MSEDKTRHIFDMNQCKRGDKLVSVHGEVLEYVGIDNERHPYRHEIKYQNGSGGSRTDNGWVFLNSPLEGDHDVKGFLDMGKKLKAYIKKVRKGDWIQIYLNDGNVMKKAEKNGYLIRSSDLQSKPIFVTYKEFTQMAKYDNWTEIDGQGV